MLATHRRFHPLPVLAGALLTLAATIPAGAAGNPDSTFSGDGRATVQLPHGLGAVATAVAVEAHGSVLAAGTTTIGDDDFVVAKLSSTGGLDTAFGSGGTAFVAFDLGGSKDDHLEEVALLAGGKIALLGGASTGTSQSLAVARLLANGQPDSFFGTGGKRVVGHPQWPTGVVYVRAAAVQADGKYLFAGSCRQCPAGSDQNSNPFVARLLANGTLDTSFGSGGWVVGPWVTPFMPDQHDGVRHLAVDSSGRILAQVSSLDVSGSVQVVRLLPSGALDASWSGDGVAVLATDPVYEVHALGVDPASGAVYSAFGVSGTGVEIRRLLPNGTTDANFAYFGTLNLADDVTVADLLVDPSGKLLAVGDTDGERFWLARILPNGTPDGSFHFDGFNEVEFNLTPNGDDIGYAAALSGTKLVTVGSAMSLLSNEALAILRTD